MQKKAKMIDSPYIIKLLKIYQDELSLHFIISYLAKMKMEVDLSIDNLGIT